MPPQKPIQLVEVGLGLGWLVGECRLALDWIRHWEREEGAADTEAAPQPTMGGHWATRDEWQTNTLYCVMWPN